jgi:hypothetical protein
MLIWVKCSCSAHRLPDLAICPEPLSYLADIGSYDGLEVSSTHGALLLSHLSPQGRPIESELPAILLQYHDRLLSHRLCLSDPLHPNHALPGRGDWASWKLDNEGPIREVSSETQGLDPSTSTETSFVY